MIQTNDALLNKINGAAVRIHYQKTDNIASSIMSAVREYNE